MTRIVFNGLSWPRAVCSGLLAAIGLSTLSTATESTSVAEKPAAVVNGTEISESKLAEACLVRHGSVVVGTLVNKLIIRQACQQQGLSVTDADVDNEINAMAKRFNVPREQWLALIQRERGVTDQQYRSDIVWPMIALRQLARGSIEPTEQQLEEQFQNQYGPTVKARIIVAKSHSQAEAIRKELLAAPDNFAALAREKSVDVGSASVGGWVQPIRRFSGAAAFEEAAFALAEGEISNVVQVADQFIIIKCEGHLPAANVQLTDVRPHLAEALRQKQSRLISTKVFEQLQQAAVVENVLNNPVEQAASPEVAARVNGEPIPLERVRNVCLERYGKDVLAGLITQVLLDQSLEKHSLHINQADLDAEVARAAETMGFVTAEGQPDVSAWLERVSREQNQAMDFYIADVVKPTVALKKLVGTVPVTRDDLDKAFAATFGPRVRCRVIVLDSQRRAQEVWQLARQDPTADKIGKLAEQYSVDPTSKALRGEVPPIQRFGGQPVIEREAFGLKPGELSGVIQVADRFLVLYCEGYTEPVEVSFAEVRDELFRDIHEKKQRIEMARFFSHLEESSAIDNFLAGTSQSPTGQSPSRLPAASELPPSTLSREEAAELATPRAGSRQQTPAVAPATYEAPVSGGRSR